jgi:hypothetical protein
MNFEGLSKKQNQKTKSVHQLGSESFNDPESNQTQRSDTNINITTPSITCGRIPWKDQVIQNWLSETREGTGMAGTSKYKFSGWISGFNKNWKFKVIITTNQDWPQPVTVDEYGKFDGVIYLDDNYRQNLPIKITIKDISNKTIKNCTVMLIE